MGRGGNRRRLTRAAHAESVEELFAALRDVGMSEDHIEELAEDIGREVTPEIQRALAAAWRPERLQ